MAEPDSYITTLQDLGKHAGAREVHLIKVRAVGGESRKSRPFAVTMPKGPTNSRRASSWNESSTSNRNTNLRDLTSLIARNVTSEGR